MANQKYNKTFLQSDSLQEAQEALEEVYEVNPDAIIIVEEEGKECLIEHEKQLNFVPSGGKEGQVLTKTENGIEFKDSQGGGGGSDVYVLPEEYAAAIMQSLSTSERVNGISIEYFNNLSDAIMNNKVVYIPMVSNGDIPIKNVYVPIYMYYTYDPNGMILPQISLNIVGYDIPSSSMSLITIKCYSTSIESSVRFLNLSSLVSDSPYSLSTLSLASPDTIQAGKQYFNEEEGKVYSKFEGFSPSNSTATILSSKPITFKGDNILLPESLPESDYILYKIEYMQTSDIKFVLVVTATPMKAPADGLIGKDVVISQPVATNPLAKLFKTEEK